MEQNSDSADMEVGGTAAVSVRPLDEILLSLFPPDPPGLIQSARLLLEAKTAYVREHPDTANHTSQGKSAKAKKQKSDLSPTRGLSPPSPPDNDNGEEPEDDSNTGAPPGPGALPEEAFVAHVVSKAKEMGKTGWGRSTVFGRLRWAERIAPVIQDEVRGTEFESVACLQALAKDSDIERQLELLASWRAGDSGSAPEVANWYAGRVKGLVDEPTRFFVPDILDHKGKLLVPSVELRCGDSMEQLAALHRDGRRFDLLATDPPFGVGRVDSDGRALRGDSDAREIAPWAVGLGLPLLREDRYALMCASDEVKPRWVWEGELLAHPDVGHVGSLTWFKQQGSGLGDSGSTFNPQTETILVAHKGNPKLHPWTNRKRLLAETEDGAPDRFSDIADDDLRRRDGNHWSIPSPRGAGPGDMHPTRKPVALGMRMALNTTDEGDEWLDPFAGCCPFGVAAIRLRRRYVGIELEEDFFKEGVRRLKSALCAKYPNQFSDAANDVLDEAA